MNYDLLLENFDVKKHIVSIYCKRAANIALPNSLRSSLLPNARLSKHIPPVPKEKKRLDQRADRELSS